MQTFTRMLITALVFGMSLSATGAEKYALLIGVAKYDHAEMNKPEAVQFPEEDAKALGDVLKAGGYTVELLLGKAATQAAIKAKLTALQKKADAEGVVLIGLFGHRVEVDTVDSDGSVIKDGCFCPFDTAMREAVDFKGRPILGANKKVMIEPDPGTLIKLGDLMRTLKLAKAANRIVLADCCRTTPNAARGRSFGANFSVQDLPDNTSLLFGCSPNEKAFEHKDWGHGAFTKCLLDSIGELSSEGPIDTAQLASQMKKRVPALVASVSTLDRQTPKPFITDVVDLQLVLPKSLTAKADARMRPTPEKPAAKSPPSSPGGDLITNSIGMKLKLISAGEFMMGSPAHEADRSEDEGPQHKVRITKPFYLGVTEVTQGEWFSVMKTNPWVAQTNVKEGDVYPATYVSWDDAVAYCDKLSALEGKQYRLPTEAEWEYACRGGKLTAYSFGSDVSGLKIYGWFDANAWDIGKKYAHEVGGKQPNPFGLHDMHGNVLEWCSDWKGDYSASVAVDPQGRSTGSRRVYRGGCWSFSAWLCRSAYRGDGDPSRRNDYLGFRLALSPPGE